MTRACRVSAALAATLALAGMSIPAARAQLSFSTEHDATYTLAVTDTTAFSDAQLLYSASDTVPATAPGSTGTVTVGLLGDPATFAWTGANGVTVSGVSTTAHSATATLISNGMPGTSGYSYVSNPGQGIISVSGSKLFFQSAPLDLTGDGAALVTSIGLQGSYTLSGPVTTTNGTGISFDIVGSAVGPDTIENLQIGSGYNVTNLFTDSGLGFVRFDAIAAVPEPGTTALLAGLALSGFGFAARLRRGKCA